MGKKATKAADNMYYLARMEAASENEELTSREKAAELLSIDRTRLARIELDTITPYPEEVKSMAACYNTPELCNQYCARECPIGKDSVKEVKEQPQPPVIPKIEELHNTTNEDKNKNDFIN